jgi:RNA polymerase sigma-B factor
VIPDLEDERLVRLTMERRDPVAVDELLRRYMPLARSLARRYAYTIEPQEDLQQVAYGAFVAALARFDPDRGSTLRSYAVPTMLGELRRHFRDKAWSVRVPRSLQERNAAVRQTVDDYTRLRGRAPRVAEIAEFTGLDATDVREALQVSRAYKAESLDVQPDDSGDLEYRSREPAYEDDGFGDAEDRAILERALRALPARERTIVELRFHGDLSQSEIGRRLGISQMHVSRLLARALARMEHVLHHLDLSNEHQGGEQCSRSS